VSLPELLRAKNIQKHFGGVCALRNASLSVRAGEAHALVGGNGAGKSTLARIIAGSLRADAGGIRMDGAVTAIRNPRDAQRLGIGIIYQELDLFRHLTIGENLVVGNLNFPERALVDFSAVDEFCRPFLERVGLRRDPREMLTRLSIGEMQLVALARALSMRARVILMDEPTSSLGEDAAGLLFRVIAELKQGGVSIVYVSHKMDEIFRVCERATVLRDGETAGTVEIATSTPEELVRLMVGRELAAAGPRAIARPPVGAAAPLLAVSNLVTEKLRGISFELGRGEVLGVAGLVGAGRSELGKALFGLDRIRAGEIRVKGERFLPRSAGAAMRRGIGLLPEDRKLQGLMMEMGVAENSAVGAPARLRRLGFLSRQREAQALEPLYRELALRYSSLSAAVKTLSGGNQQKALLARWLLVNPDILFLDDPARGIDVAAKQDIYRIIAALAAAGKGVILASSELPELLRCSDRVMVLAGGRMTAMFSAAEATPERIMAASTGAGAVA
jgi:ABC-type sugar transport system ATPase subunit